MLNLINDESEFVHDMDSKIKQKSKKLLQKNFSDILVRIFDHKLLEHILHLDVFPIDSAVFFYMNMMFELLRVLHCRYIHAEVELSSNLLVKSILSIKNCK